MHSPLYGMLGALGMARQYTMNAEPVVASYWQTSSYTDGNTFLISEAVMADGVPHPCSGTGSAGGADLAMGLTLVAPAFVTAVRIGCTTSASGWGAQYLNDRQLEYSPTMNGDDWQGIVQLAGFITPGAPGVSFGPDSLKEIPVGVVLQRLRVRRGTAGSGAYAEVGFSEMVVIP